MKTLGFGGMEISLTVKDGFHFVFYPDSTCLYSIPGFTFKGIWKHNPQTSIVNIFEDDNDKIEELKLLFNFYDNNRANVKFLSPENEKKIVSNTTLNMLNIGAQNKIKTK